MDFFICDNCNKRTSNNIKKIIDVGDIWELCEPCEIQYYIFKQDILYYFHKCFFQPQFNSIQNFIKYIETIPNQPEQILD